jgi:hypothetical protein
MDTPTLSAAWQKFGISEPVGELATHSDPALRSLTNTAKLYGTLAPELEVHFCALALMAYGMGMSAGRLTALDNPGAAMQAEVQALVASGVRAEDIGEAIQQAMKGGGI